MGPMAARRQRHFSCACTVVREGCSSLLSSHNGLKTARTGLPVEASGFDPIFVCSPEARVEHVCLYGHNERSLFLLRQLGRPSLEPVNHVDQWWQRRKPRVPVHLRRLRPG